MADVESDIQVEDRNREPNSILLLKMAASLIASIYRRAFVQGKAAVGTRGQHARPLQESYGWYKSGTRPYVSPATREAAYRKRAKSGKQGPGPLVNILGIRTRLGPRSNQPDQRLSDSTAKALGVVGLTDTQVTVGFRGDRAQKVAGFLEKRNAFFYPTEAEKETINRLARAALGRRFEGVKIYGKVKVKLKLPRF